MLTTGMGEAMSDFLGQQSVPAAGAIDILGIALAFRLQFAQRAYRAPQYWFAVMMVVVFGTMAADGIRDGAGLTYAVTTPLFALATAGIFALWYRSEGTLSAPSRSAPRQLGASIADWVAKPAHSTGLGLGDGVVSAVALVMFVALVAYAAVTRRDVQHSETHRPVRAHGAGLESGRRVAPAEN